MTGQRTRQKLGLDVDGVIVNYYQGLLDYANPLLGANFGYHEAVCHDLSVNLGLTEDEVKALLDDYENSAAFDEVQPLTGALEALTLLSEQYDCVIITSRRDNLIERTQSWFDRNFPHVTIHHTIGRNNSFAGGDNRIHKPDLAEKVGVVCLIEDNEHEFYHWNSTVVEPICFAQPWNQSIAHSHPHIPRLEWPGILERFLR